VKQIRQRLTYANVMSSIAVFFVLGGATAFAATKIGANEIKANSIKTGKIVKEAVTAGKIKNSAVNTSKLANDAVTNGKLGNLAVTTDKIADKAVTASKINVAGLGQVPSAANANTVGGFGPSGLVRSAYDSTNSSVSLTSEQTVLSATIAAPSNGYLLVTANGTWSATGANALIHAGLDLDDPSGSGWSGDDSRSISEEMETATTTAGAPSARFPVTAGTHTVRLKAHNDGASTLSFRGGSLTVLFEPFGSGGSQGNGTSAFTAASADENG